jgi:RNA polymerase sigma-70 factor (ECF subfamily)
MTGFESAELQAQIPRLRRYARALTGDREAADDLTQDTLERAWSKRALWKPPGPGEREGSLRGWLLAVMHNVFVNSVRRVRPVESLDAMTEDGQFDVAAPDELETAIQVHDVAAALARLPEDHRAVLLLVAVEQLSYAQAASVLEVPIGTVMSRLSRARDRLRSQLTGVAVTEPEPNPPTAQRLRLIK